MEVKTKRTANKCTSFIIGDTSFLYLYDRGLIVINPLFGKTEYINDFVNKNIAKKKLHLLCEELTLREFRKHIDYRSSVT